MSQIHRSVYGHFTIVSMSHDSLKLWWNVHKCLGGIGTWSKSIVFMVKTFAVYTFLFRRLWTFIYFCFEVCCKMYGLDWFTSYMYTLIWFSTKFPTTRLSQPPHLFGTLEYMQFTEVLNYECKVFILGLCISPRNNKGISKQ